MPFSLVVCRDLVGRKMRLAVLWVNAGSAANTAAGLVDEHDRAVELGGEVFALAGAEDSLADRRYGGAPRARADLEAAAKADAGRAVESGQIYRGIHLEPSRVTKALIGSSPMHGAFMQLLSARGTAGMRKLHPRYASGMATPLPGRRPEPQRWIAWQGTGLTDLRHWLPQPHRHKRPGDSVLPCPRASAFRDDKQMRWKLKPLRISNPRLRVGLVDRRDDLVSPKLDLAQHCLLVEIPQLGLNCDLVRFQDIHLFQ